MVLAIDVPTDAGTRRVLFVGDLEREGMDALLRRHPRLRADAMEAPHHGSARPFAVEFVEGIGPGVVVQSTGPTRIGHPIWDPVRARAEWWSTAEHGAIALEVLRDGALRAGPALD